MRDEMDQRARQESEKIGLISSFWAGPERAQKEPGDRRCLQGGGTQKPAW